jgi:hypothetical protein
MDPSDMCPVEDYSPETLTMLSDALEQSTSREHFIYREAELDDLWRLLDTALGEARRDSRASERAEQLEQLRAITMRAHDLVGSDERPREAAAVLRTAIGTRA